MQDVAPGRTIGDRYLLTERRLASGDGIEAWAATDTTLDAGVTLTLLPRDLPVTEAALDAARRAAVVDDHRIVRILDVGTSETLCWIAEEAMPGVRSLVELVREGPLTGEQCRTVVGETATALDAAARRGVHHVRLSPYSILVEPSGAVRVSGLGTALAVEGGEEPEGARAELLDTVGLLAVAYYAMTTRWPLPREVTGLDPAPRVVGGVPAPSEIAAGVPVDLDYLCRTTLNGQPGPESPGELASEIAPWRKELLDPSGLPAPAPVIPPPDASGEDSDATAPLPVAEVTTEALPAVDLSTLPPPAPPATPVSAPGAVAASVPHPSGPGDLSATSEQTTDHDTAGEDPDAGTSASSPSAALGAAAEGAAAVTAKLGTFARAAADKAAAARREHAERRAAADHLPEGHLEDLHVSAGRYEPLGPLLRLDPAERPGAHSRLVISIVAGMALLMFIWSLTVVVPMFTGGGEAKKPNTTASRSGTGATTSPAPAAPPQPVKITSSTAYDPSGDGTENNEQIPRAYDGNAQTGWRSEQYYSDPRWGSSATAGVGLVFRIPAGTVIRKVSLTFGTVPQTATVYVSTKGDSLAGATKVGAVSDATGAQNLDVTGAPPAEYVIVWFTKAPSEGGFFRASLNEIALAA